MAFQNLGVEAFALPRADTINKVAEDAAGST